MWKRLGSTDVLDGQILSTFILIFNFIAVFRVSEKGLEIIIYLYLFIRTHSSSLSIFGGKVYIFKSK